MQGKPLKTVADLEGRPSGRVVLTEAEAQELGLCPFKLSDECLRDLKELDEFARSSLWRLRNFPVGCTA